MKERPILFSAPMVRAILAGRKVQTRRIVKPQPVKGRNSLGVKLTGWWWERGNDAFEVTGREIRGASPYGTPGDRLWVKETWRPRIAHACVPGACDCDDVMIEYAAGGEATFHQGDRVPEPWRLPKAAKRGNVSPLFMPRWASRITLEITEVRLQRLQAIGDFDADQEGVEGWVHDPRCETPRDGFRVLWETINGPGSWKANPWVWAIAFRRIAPAGGTVDAR